MSNGRTQKRGYIMLDTLIVMTVTVAVLSMSSLWIYKTLGYSREVDQRLQHVRSISRVGHQLRGDAIEATSIGVEGGVLRLQTDRQLTRYEIKDHLIERRATTAIEGSKTVHRDDFQFAPNAVLSWEDIEDAVLLNIHRDFSARAPGKEKTVPCELRLDSQIRISAVPQESP